MGVRRAFDGRRGALLTAVALVVNLLTAAGVVVIRVGARGTPVTPGQALAQFRERQGARPAANPSGRAAGVGGGARRPASLGPSQLSRPGIGSSSPAATRATPPPSPGPGSSPAGTLPPVGVYSYTTSGYEQVAVPGSRRDFPKQTAMTVESSGCGVVQTWQPFQQHTEKTTVCMGAQGPRLFSYYVAVSFYGQNQTQTVFCGADAYLYTWGAASGKRWSYTCQSNQTTAQNHAELIGYQTLVVGGTAVRTAHVHVDTVTSGPNGTGNSPADYWFDTTNAILVRNTGTVSSNGSAHYYEQYDLELDSLKPRT